MIQTFVDRFMQNKDKLKETFTTTPPDDYSDIVRAVIETITTDTYSDFAPDPDRVHSINDGDYQGTLVFVIGEKGYQPSTYYYVQVDYGSCSGCDTLEACRMNDDVDGYMTLALHIVQALKKMRDDED